MPDGSFPNRALYAAVPRCQEPHGLHPTMCSTADVGAKAAADWLQLDGPPTSNRTSQSRHLKSGRVPHVEGAVRDVNATGEVTQRTAIRSPRSGRPQHWAGPYAFSAVRHQQAHAAHPLLLLRHHRPSPPSATPSPTATRLSPLLRTLPDISWSLEARLPRPLQRAPRRPATPRRQPRASQQPLLTHLAQPASLDPYTPTSPFDPRSHTRSTDYALAPPSTPARSSTRVRNPSS